jgi:general secretion pathway protein E
VFAISEAASDPFHSGAVSRDYLLHHRVCPDGFDGDGALVVAIGPGAFLEAIPELASVYERRVVARNVTDDDLQRMIERITTNAGDGTDPTSASDDDTADVREIANQPPVIRYVNTLLHDAFEAGASDIHIESTRSGATTRVRVDGVLAPSIEPPRRMHDAVVSRIKLLADLDISERRRPQDGRIRVRIENTELFLRVSTVPTVHGESVVLRLLDRGTRPVGLAALGMPDDILREMSEAIDRPHGMVLVTGPTGSGKTTTLYSALRRRDIRAEKVVTVEDPVEYQLEGVTQVPVHRQAGVTFASALRSILRQDPDVVMIGEMRDTETAEIAIQASMTGHLVFSTLHTNDAIGALPRLFDLGIAPYLVAATLTAIMAQRLVRLACPACKVSEIPRADVVSLQHELTPELVTSDFVRATGCPACRGTGYKGRVGIFEIVSVDEAMQSAISSGAHRSDLQALASSSGYRPMIADGLAKAATGITTLDEVMRVCNA